MVSECWNQPNSHARAPVRATVLVAPLFLIDFRILGPTDTIRSDRTGLHRIRRHRFGGVPPSLYQFSIGFVFSERKCRFATPRNIKKSAFSNFFELFASWLLPLRHKTAKTTQNSHLGSDHPIRHATTQNAGPDQNFRRFQDPYNVSDVFSYQMQALTHNARAGRPQLITEA